MLKFFAINIDPENSAEEYRNRVTRPLEGISSKEEIKKIREDLSGAYTTEIASFDEFSRFVSGEAEGADLGELNRVLVEKVEELTLYILQLEERLQKLEIQK